MASKQIILHFFSFFFSLGQDRFHAMARTYFRGASGCVVMFDVTNQKSFDSALEWKHELDTKVELPNGDRIPCVLLANKVGAWSQPRPSPA